MNNIKRFILILFIFCVNIVIYAQNVTDSLIGIRALYIEPVEPNSAPITIKYSAPFIVSRKI